MTHIPYKGGGPALTDLLGGQVELFVAIISTAVPQVKAGKARGLAVTGDKRAAALPDVPTVDESGVKGYESTNWYCMLGPANLPGAIVERWHKEMTAALNAPEIKQALFDRGIDAAPTTPAEFTAYLKSETAKMDPRRQGFQHQTGLRLRSQSNFCRRASAALLVRRRCLPDR